jgi:hypothetical protein
MLFDPNNWDQRTKADPLSLASLLAWLEQQPPRARYRYDEPSACLIAQWIRAVAPERDHLLRPHEVSALFGGCGDHIVLGDLGDRQTFGAALERARAIFALA